MTKLSFNLHNKNTEFTWRQPPPPYNLVSAEQADAYRELGGFVLHDVFDTETLSDLVAELDPIEARVNDQLQDLPAGTPSIARPDEIVFQAHVVQSCPMAKRLASHPTLVALCKDLIGPQVRLYWDQLVYKRPATAVEFPWHQDNGYTFVLPQQYLTCWIALTDATIENGCPWIMPQVHQSGTLAHRWTSLGFECFETAPAGAIPMPVSAGSVVVFSSLTPHRTGPNLTTDIRKSYILQYAPDGAMVYPHQGEAYLANDPDRQFLVCEKSI